MRSTGLPAIFPLVAATLVTAQEPQPPTDNPAQTQTPAPGERGRPTPPSQDPQPYEKVISKDAKSKKGLFTVHQVKDKYYYELPKSQLNKEFLLGHSDREDDQRSRLRRPDAW